jgi:DNA-binding response OmpR family regulator
MSELPLKARINLARASIMLLDDNFQGLGILVQILTGFGAKVLHRCTSIADAKDVAVRMEIDLILANGSLREAPAFDFVSWLRTSRLAPNCFAPTILVCGHTPVSYIRTARDCGANFIVAKPLTPITLLERIVWVAGEKRPFVSCSTYIGPDRRFHDSGPPEGMVGRRHDDAAKAAVREAELQAAEGQAEEAGEPERIAQ